MPEPESAPDPETQTLLIEKQPAVMFHPFDAVFVAVPERLRLSAWISPVKVEVPAPRTVICEPTSKLWVVVALPVMMAELEARRRPVTVRSPPTVEEAVAIYPPEAFKVKTVVVPDWLTFVTVSASPL